MLTTLHSPFTTDTAVHPNCTEAHQDRVPEVVDHTEAHQDRVQEVVDHTEAHLGTDLEVGDRC